jgi:Rrf2 family protein
MTFLSRKADYALLILYFLSKRASGASSREIADSFKLGRPFLANILKNLCQAGLVISQRGVNGGYTIAREPGEIRLTEVLDALTESFKLNECNHNSADLGNTAENHCAVIGMCPIRQGMESLHERILGMLSDVRLSELFAPAPGLRLIDLNIEPIRPSKSLSGEASRPLETV